MLVCVIDNAIIVGRKYKQDNMAFVFIYVVFCSWKQFLFEYASSPPVCLSIYLSIQSPVMRVGNHVIWKFVVMFILYWLVFFFNGKHILCSFSSHEFMVIRLSFFRLVEHLPLVISHSMFFFFFFKQDNVWKVLANFLKTSLKCSMDEQ